MPHQLINNSWEQREAGIDNTDLMHPSFKFHTKWNTLSLFKKISKQFIVEADQGN